MAQSNTRIRMFLFSVLGLVVFTSHFLYSMSQKSNTAVNPVAKKAMDEQSAAELLVAAADLSDKEIRSMIETHMNALFEGGRTGNFTALHELGAPDFQNRNTPVKLHEIFSKFLNKNVDLNRIDQYEPTQKRKPYFDKDGKLHLVGHYPTKPLQVHYDLSLQAVGGIWRLFSISVNALPAS